MGMTDAGTTQDNFILPAPPANLPGLAWQNEACSQPHHSNHLAKWNNILADTMFKISIGHTNIGMRQLERRYGQLVTYLLTYLVS